MKSRIKFAPFTMPQGRAPRMIVSPVEIANPEKGFQGSIVKLSSTAQWDTGADYCMISPRLARDLRLISAGEASVNAVEGTDCRRTTYRVHMALPNGIILEDILAIEDPGLKDVGVDFLIGLNVINELDFALTHDRNADSVLSISFPGARLVDFSKC